MGGFDCKLSLFSGVVFSSHSAALDIIDSEGLCAHFHLVSLQSPFLLGIGLALNSHTDTMQREKK